MSRMRWRQPAAIFLLIAGSALAAHASDATSGGLAGRVVDAETGEPVGWTMVLVEGLYRARHSDADGYFLFSALPAGIHVLQTLRVGYHNKQFHATVASGDTVHVVLPVGHEPVVLETVVVGAKPGQQISPLQEPEIVFSEKWRKVIFAIAFSPDSRRRTLRHGFSSMGHTTSRNGFCVLTRQSAWG